MDSSFVDHEEELPTMNTYSCDSCGKTYKTLANLKRHLDDTHSDKLFQCETCDKQFTAKRNILSHHKRRHQQSDTTYLCPHCGKKYLAESSMYSHVRYKHKQAGQLYVNFVTSGSRTTMHLTDIWKTTTIRKMYVPDAVDCSKMLNNIPCPVRLPKQKPINVVIVIKSL
jgi:DNA-directed RNA polymerase subunit RPC12/RpoP